MRKSSIMVNNKNSKALFKRVNSKQKLTKLKNSEIDKNSSDLSNLRILENLPIGIYRTTPGGNIIYINQTLVKMLGYSSFKELAGRNLEKEGFNISYPRSYFKRLIKKEGEVRKLESSWLKKDKSVIFVRENARAIRDNRGRIIYYEGTAENISELKKAEWRIKESKNVTENLIACMKDGLSVLDNKGVHLNVNTALCNITGFRWDELVGTAPPHPFWPEEEYKNIEEAFRKILKGHFDDFELIFKRKNGERFPVIVSPSWIKDEKGNIICYFATVKDISERKKAEGEILAAKEYTDNIIKSMVDLLIVIGPNSKIKTINKATSDILGYNENELIGKPIGMILAEEEEEEEEEED